MLLQKLFNPEAIIVRKVDKINPLLYKILVLLFLGALVMIVNQVFSLGLLGFKPIGTAYTYYLIGIFLSSVFIIFPFNEKSIDKIPFYDIILFIVTIFVNFYFARHAIDIIMKGWELSAPQLPTVFSVVLWALIIEAVRRSSGLLIACLCFIFSFYPLYCGKLPGILSGVSYNFFETARSHAMGAEAILGIPLTSLGTVLAGFLLFGVVLSSTGGGPFFLDIAQGLLGHKPGGPAKVAVLASALFGSISGSAVANVVTTGSITIPAMKKIGIKPDYAAAIESCASTGGIIAPPVMGAAAFVMASFLGMPYALIVAAAIIPSVLFYSGLFFQIDLYSHRIGLKGLPKEDIPLLKDTFKKGWFYLIAIAVLIYFLFVERADSYAPFYSALSIIILAAATRNLSFNKITELLYEFGNVVARIVALLGSVGLIIGALSRTGVALSFSRELVVVTDSVFVLLVTGAIASFILGMGMVSVAVYIFLAIVMGPALIAAGIMPIAAHFFVLYWGVVSFITPPVALASFTAAGVANSNPMKTGLLSMRLGMLLYVIPFMFVYNPALLGQGPIGEVLITFVLGMIGVYFLASGFEGYFHKVGALPMLSRAFMLVSGILTLMPETVTDIVGIVLAAATLLITKKSLLIRKRVA